MSNGLRIPDGVLWREMDRLGALWPPLRDEKRQRLGEYAEAIRRDTRIEAGDLVQGVRDLIDDYRGQYPPTAAEVRGMALAARQKRLDAVPRRRPADGPGPQIRRVVGRTCSRGGCHGALDLLTAEGVLWCGRCRSVQRAAHGTERVRLTDDERDALTFADPLDLPDREGPPGVESARALIATLAERKALPQVGRSEPDDPKLAELWRIQADAYSAHNGKPTEA